MTDGKPTPEGLYADEWLMRNAEANLARVFGPLGLALIARTISVDPEWWEYQPVLTFSASGLLLHVIHCHLQPNAPEPNFEPWPMFQYHNALHAYPAHHPLIPHHHADLPPGLKGA